MIDLTTYRERFGESGWRVLGHAIASARRRTQNYISIEHIIDALADEEVGLFDQIINDLALNPQEVRAFIEKRIECGLTHRGAGIRVAPAVNRLFRLALSRARAANRQAIESTDILVTLSQNEKGLFVEILRSFGAAPEAVAESAHVRVRIAESEFTRIRVSTPEMEYAVGETVRIKSGPFAAFTGRIESFYEDKSKLKIAVSIFGRSTPVELSFHDVEKITFTQEH